MRQETKDWVCKRHLNKGNKIINIKSVAARYSKKAGMYLFGFMITTMIGQSVSSAWIEIP